MRKRFMVVILILGILFIPSLAYADDGFGGSDGGDFSDQIVYGPSAIDVLAQRFGVQVYSGNKFNAALCALGYNPYSDIFTSDVKAYLSNASTGGAFSDFADLFQHDLTYFGVDPLGVTWSSALAVNNGLYGKDSVWCAVYEESLFDAAKERVQAVLNGNTGGGSGETGELPSTITVDRTNYCVGTSFGTLPDNIFQQVTANLTGGYIDRFKQYMTTRPYLLIYAAMQSNSNLVKFYLACSSSPWQYQRHANANGSANFDGFLTQSLDVWRVETRSVTAYTANVTAGSFSDITHDTSESNVFPNCVWLTLPTNYAALYRFENMDEPVVPPTQWPEPDPVTPTEPPEVPSPTPTEPPAEPTTPQFGIPQLPNIGLTTEPTYQTADLTAVLDAMAKHCQHLQTCMTECFDSYYSAITQYEKSIQENSKEFFRSWFRVTLDTIRDCFDDLSDYLQRLFTWLADQMDFTFTGGDFDDSSIVWWLKRIYSKLGSGTTVRPTDPVVDPKGIGDWFDQLIKNFVLDLLALGQDFLADVVEMFRQLTTKFPISIPWDIVAILTLFAAEPETPVLNIPQYALTGVNTISQVGTYVIDLQDYDGVMSVVRNVEKVVFAFWLCWKIDFFKQAFDIMTGGK